MLEIFNRRSKQLRIHYLGLLEVRGVRQFCFHDLETNTNFHFPRLGQLEQTLAVHRQSPNRKGDDDQGWDPQRAVGGPQGNRTAGYPARTASPPQTDEAQSDSGSCEERSKRPLTWITTTRPPCAPTQIRVDLASRPSHAIITFAGPAGRCQYPCQGAKRKDGQFPVGRFWRSMSDACRPCRRRIVVRLRIVRLQT